MQKYIISDLKAGMKANFLRIITAEMLQKFYEIAGEGNPLVVQ